MALACYLGGLVYGITLLNGHLMETILIIIVVDDIGLGLEPREQV